MVCVSVRRPFAREGNRPSGTSTRGRPAPKIYASVRYEFTRRVHILYILTVFVCRASGRPATTRSVRRQQSARPGSSVGPS